MNSHTGLNVHHQNTIGITIDIRTIHEMCFNRDRRNAKIERYTQQFIQMVFVTIDTCNAPVVFNAYHHIATICISKSHLDYRQCFCIDTKAFAIELLALRLLLKCLYIVEVNHHLLSVNVFNNSFSDCIVSDSACMAFWKSRMASRKSICSSGSNVST